jgi:endoglucanase
MAVRGKPFRLGVLILASMGAAGTQLLLAPVCVGVVTYTGVNLAGADFGEGSLPGTYGTHYTYPTAAEVDYFIGKGMNTFRLPFRWERLQQSLNSPFDAAELARLDGFVDYATGQGAYVVLDPHNYARYYGNIVGSASVPHASFADFWTRLADEYQDNDRVIFGLMNEPNTMPTEQWRDSAQEAITAIRDTGATNLILVPGNAWTGAHSWTQNWYGTPNATAMLSIVDPADNFAFDVHQYLDDNSSGGSAQIVSPTIGQERLVQFTNWLHTNDRRGFLGEFAVANSTIGTSGTQIGDEAIDNMLDYIQANGDVWLGWMWWAAGPWWGNYMFTLEPTNLGLPTETDRPALAVLQPHLAFPSPDPPGDFNRDGTVDAADYVVWRHTLGQYVPLGSGADGDRDGLIDDDDYSFWTTNFGATFGSGARAQSATTVPEPSAASMMSFAALAIVVAQRRFVSIPVTRRGSRPEGSHVDSNQ